MSPVTINSNNNDSNEIDNNYNNICNNNIDSDNKGNNDSANVVNIDNDKNNDYMVIGNENNESTTFSNQQRNNKSLAYVQLFAAQHESFIKLQQLLQEEKDESARIKVENIIREDYQIEALDILELFCELLQSRIQMIAEAKTCPHDMKEAVHTMIYSASHIDIIEFESIRKQFELRWGKEFVKNATENKDLAVNQRVLFKLGVKVPEPYLCVQYMKEIARENNIKWEDTSFSSQSDQPIGLNDHQDFHGETIQPETSKQNQDLQTQILLLQQQLELQQKFQQLNQQQSNQQSQQKVQNIYPTKQQQEDTFDPLSYVNDLKKKQGEKKCTKC